MHPTECARMPDFGLFARLFFHLENKQLGIKKVRYFKANNNWIYLIPLQDGRLLTAYGDVPPSVADPMIQSIYQRK